MNTGEILRAAATRVRRGWGQHRWRDADSNQVCAEDALIECGHGIAWVCAVQAAVRLLDLKKAAPENKNPMPWWNDQPGQTAENVAAGLEYAALLWEQEQAVSLVNTVAAPVEAPVSAQFAQKDLR